MILRPNWRNSVQVQHVFRTEIFTSRGGYEQRRALRSTPRKQVAFSVTKRAAERQDFHRYLSSAQNQILPLVDPTRFVVCNAIAAGSSAVTVDEVPAWLIAGRRVALEGEDSIETLTVTSVDALTVTVASPTAGAWAEGTLLRPVLTTRLPDAISAVSQTDNLFTVSMSFDVVSTTEPNTAPEPIDEGEIDRYVFNGREIWPFDMNWGDTVGFTYNWVRDDVDFGFGRTSTLVPGKFGTLSSQAGYIQMSAAEVATVEQFFQRMLGRCKEFYATTGTDDLTLVAPLVVNSDTITVRGAIPATDVVYRTIRIELATGQHIHRQITAAAPVGDNTTLTLNVPLYVAGDVAMISWLCVCRFSSDALVIEWLSDQVARSKISMTRLPEAPPEGGLPIYGANELYILETQQPDYIDMFDPLYAMVNVQYPAIYDTEQP